MSARLDKLEHLDRGPQTKALGFTIRIFAAAGELDGLQIVEKSNWNGRGLLCPRALLRLARSRKEFTKPAVYVLTGPSEDGTLPRIYIGEGDPVGPRIDNHASRKDFWTQVILFCAKDDALNKAHIQYLEARLVALANEARRAELENSNVPEEPTLSEPDWAEAEGFVREMLLCFPLIGIRAFEQAAIAVPQSTVLSIRGKGIIAHGFDTSAGFLVKQGSQIVAQEVPSTQAYVRELRRVLHEKGIFRDVGSAWEVTKDYRFDSPSTAASVVLGKSANGRTEWRDKAGRTLRDLQDSTAAKAKGAAT